MKSVKKQDLELNVAYDFCQTKEPKLTVVFIHGIAADASSFQKAATTLAENPTFENVRFLAFDLLGVGKSLTTDELEYDYDEQLTALKNTLDKLEIKTPLVLVGHSMGTLIATRFAAKNPGMVEELILVSPPIYTPEDIKSPLYKKAMAGFRAVITAKNPEFLEQKSFNNELEKIVSDLENYRFLIETKKSTTLIYGDGDEIIASFNIPKVLAANEKIKAIKTVGTHGISSAKTAKIAEELERILDEII